MNFHLCLTTDVIDYLGCKPGDVFSCTYYSEEKRINLYLLYFSIDPFTRKDWYDIKAPSMFAVRQVGKTLVNRTQGTRKSFTCMFVTFLGSNYILLKVSLPRA